MNKFHFVSPCELRIHQSRRKLKTDYLKSLLPYTKNTGINIFQFIKKAYHIIVLVRISQGDIIKFCCQKT